MNEIMQALNSEGFYPDSVIPDGKIHRFKRDRDDKGKSAWYVAHQNHTQKGGEIFYVAAFGDWREPGNDRKYCSLTTVSKYDRKVIDDQMQVAEKRRKEEQAQVWDETSKDAQKLWLEFSDVFDSEYFRKKKIDALYGTKTAMTSYGRVIYVPVRDTKGQLWGLQKIGSDGSKYFMPGTKKAGNFHSIGDLKDAETIRVVEGFATGVSVYMATKEPVVIAFDAGNLSNVCESIKKEYPDASLIICGDDDKWTQDNPGRTKADGCALKFLGQCIFPEFRDTEGHPTDWNDLHCREGIDAVKDQLLGVKVEKSYLLCLGTYRNTFYYISSLSKRVISLSPGAHTANNLFNLMPLEYWEQVYPSKQGGVNWNQAISELMRKCHSVGAFMAEKVRGIGAWEDGGKIIVNLGDALWVDNKRVPLNGIKSRHIYQSGPVISEPHANPLTVAECRQLIDACTMLSWKKKQSGLYLAGFLAIAPLCGALQWRPHLWITGSAGTGKSSILQLLVRPILGELSHYFLGNTTEAGIRQTLGCDARPVIFDEFETNDKSSDMRVKAVLELFRQASSESEARIVKGSADGSAVDFRVRYCGIVCSIRVNLTNEADRTRFTTCELDRSDLDPEKWVLIRNAFDKMGNEFRDRLFSRMVRMWPVFKANLHVYHSVLTARHSARFAQQYGALLSSYGCLISDNALSREEIEMFVDSIDFKEEKGSASSTDELECVNHVINMTARLEIKGTMFERTVKEYIQAAIYDEEYNAGLQRVGFYVKDGFVHVANNHPGLSKLYSNTKWASGWRSSILRFPGAEVAGDVSRYGEKVSRSVKIPLKSIL